jgi:hypothetical protein
MISRYICHISSIAAFKTDIPGISLFLNVKRDSCHQEDKLPFLIIYLQILLFYFVNTYRLQKLGLLPVRDESLSQAFTEPVHLYLNIKASEVYNMSKNAIWKIWAILWSIFFQSCFKIQELMIKC